MKKRICLYVNEDVWKEFTSISHREGESASEKTEQFFKQYNEKHRVGNPQTVITKFSGESKSTAKCFCGEPATHHVEANNGWKGFLCASHYEQNREARLLKKWKMV